MQHLFFFILPLAWLFSVCGTALLLPFLRKAHVLDVPSERSNHSAPVPRGGGIAMIASAVFFLWLAHADYHMLISVGMLAIISFIDDMRGLSVRIRLLAQCAAVVFCMPVLVPFLLPLTPWASLSVALVIVFAWLWFINLTNFMDGIDGITSMQVIAMSVGVCMVCVAAPRMAPFLPVAAAIIAAAVLGFYAFNRSPAKCFMGDVGSIPLGFLMGYVLLTLGLSDEPFAALILPAYYLSDATFTLLRRALRGAKVWQAHSEHAYQKAVRAGLSHHAVVRRISLMNSLLILLAILSTISMMAGVISLLLAYVVTALFIYRLSHETLPQ